MKRKIMILAAIFAAIVGTSFFYGIINNPAFNINDFFANLSSEFIGWILAVTIFQYYYDEKMKAKKPKNDTNKSLSVADEILKLKLLLDDGIITLEEFENGKSRLLGK